MIHFERAHKTPTVNYFCPPDNFTREDYFSNNLLGEDPPIGENLTLHNWNNLIQRNFYEFKLGGAHLKQRLKRLI
jgi:hypothetical protein